MADEHRMGEFWDERAREDAMFFVDDRMRYGAADEERFWVGGREAVDLILGELGVELAGQETVVEIGCGVGRVTRELAARAERVVAIDVSERMLALAREHNPGLRNVTWLHGNGADLAGVGDGEADACFSHVVFQHIPDPAVTLGYVREMGRVLAPGRLVGVPALQPRAGAPTARTQAARVRGRPHRARAARHRRSALAGLCRRPRRAGSHGRRRRAPGGAHRERRHAVLPGPAARRRLGGQTAALSRR